MDESPGRSPESGPLRRPSSYRALAMASAGADPAANGTPTTRRQANSHLRRPYARPQTAKAAGSQTLEDLEAGGGTGPMSTPKADSSGAQQPAKAPSTVQRWASWLLSPLGRGKPRSGAESALEEHLAEQRKEGDLEASSRGGIGGGDEALRQPAAKSTRLPPSNLRHSTTLPTLSASGVGSPFLGPGPSPPLVNGSTTAAPNPFARLPGPKRRSSHATLNLGGPSDAPARPPSPDRVQLPGSWQARAGSARPQISSSLAPLRTEPSLDSIGDYRMRDPSPFRQPLSAGAGPRSGLPNSGSSFSFSNSNRSPVLPASASTRSGSPFRPAGSPFLRTTESPFRSAPRRAGPGLSTSASLPFLAAGGGSNGTPRRKGISPLTYALSSAVIAPSAASDSRRSPAHRGPSPIGSAISLGKRGRTDASLSPPRAGGAGAGPVGGSGAFRSELGESPAKKHRIWSDKYNAFLTMEENLARERREELERRRREGVAMPANHAERLLEAMEGVMGPVGSARRMMARGPIRTPAPTADHVSARSALDEYSSLHADSPFSGPGPKRTIAPATRGEQLRRQEQAEIKKGKLRREMQRRRAEEAEREAREREARLRYEGAEKAAMRSADAMDEGEDDDGGDRTVVRTEEVDSPSQLRRSTRRTRSVSVEPTSPAKAGGSKRAGARGKTPSTRASSVVDEQAGTPRRSTRAGSKPPAATGPPPTSTRRATRATTKSPEPELAPVTRVARKRPQTASDEPDSPAKAAKAKTIGIRSRKIKAPSPIDEEAGPAPHQPAPAPAVPAAVSAPMAKSRSTPLRPSRSLFTRRHASARIFAPRFDDDTDNEEDQQQSAAPNPAFDKIKLDFGSVFPSGFKSSAATTASPTPTPTPAPPSFVKKQELDPAAAMPARPTAATATGFASAPSQEKPERPPPPAGPAFGGFGGQSTGFSFGQAAAASKNEASAPPAFSFAKPADPSTLDSNFFGGPAAASLSAASAAASGTTTPTFDFARKPKDAQPPNFFNLAPSVTPAVTTEPANPPANPFGLAAPAMTPAASGESQQQNTGGVFGGANGLGGASSAFCVPPTTTETAGSAAFSFGTKPAEDKIQAPKSVFGAPSTGAGFSFSKPAEQPAAPVAPSMPSVFGNKPATNGNGSSQGFSFAPVAAVEEKKGAPPPSTFGFGGSTNPPLFVGAFGTAVTSAAPAATASPFVAPAPAPSPFGGFGHPAATQDFDTAMAAREVAMDADAGANPSPFARFGSSGAPNFSFGTQATAGSSTPFVFGGGGASTQPPNPGATGGGGFGFAGGSTAMAPSTSSAGGAAFGPANTGGGFSFSGANNPGANGFGRGGAAPFGGALPQGGAPPTTPTGGPGTPGGFAFAMGAGGGDQGSGRPMRRLPNRRKR